MTLIRVARCWGASAAGGLRSCLTSKPCSKRARLCPSTRAPSGRTDGFRRWMPCVIRPVRSDARLLLLAKLVILEEAAGGGGVLPLILRAALLAIAGAHGRTHLFEGEVADAHAWIERYGDVPQIADLKCDLALEA